MDMSKIRQYNIMHRWAYVAPEFISQLSMRALADDRDGGQTTHGHSRAVDHLYTTQTRTRRYEAQWKNALLFDDGRNSSLALILHGSHHNADYAFGHNLYDVIQHFAAETTSGLYAQYTFKPHNRFSIMPGVRYDYSSRFGGFVTPRLHLKFQPADVLTLRASAGKGYRSPHAFAENVTLLASGRTFLIDNDLQQEEAWNYGISASLKLPIADKQLELNAEYYYTDFRHQMVVNIDGAAGAHTVRFENLHGSSYSHTLQLDATYPFFEGFSATAAFRYNDARTTYDGTLRRRPLTSRYKGLLTLSYKTPLELWHFDLTGHLNGSGDLYDHTSYPTFFQLQAQITREFRHFSIYLGGENLTGYKITHPIIGAANPWSPAFDATQIYGPTEGAMAYIGIRFNLENL